jgi:hypothetical protein
MRLATAITLHAACSFGVLRGPYHDWFVYQKDGIPTMSISRSIHALKTRLIFAEHLHHYAPGNSDFLSLEYAASHSDVLDMV